MKCQSMKAGESYQPVAGLVDALRRERKLHPPWCPGKQHQWSKKTVPQPKPHIKSDTCCKEGNADLPVSYSTYCVNVRLKKNLVDEAH